MLVERVEQVNLSYTAETPLVAVYTHPKNLFSFAYPEGWSLDAEDEGDHLTLFNHPPEKQHFMGPGIQYGDPTSIYLSIKVIDVPLETFVQNRQEEEHLGEDVALEDQVAVHVSQREIGGWQVTQIDKDYFLWGTYREYVVPLNDDAVLVFDFYETHSSFAERLITTLAIP